MIAELLETKSLLLVGICYIIAPIAYFVFMAIKHYYLEDPIPSGAKENSELFACYWLVAPFSLAASAVYLAVFIPFETMKKLYRALSSSLYSRK